MLNDPLYISKETLCFVYDKLFTKVMAASIENSIVAAVVHLNVNREKSVTSSKEQCQSIRPFEFTINTLSCIELSEFTSLPHKFSTLQTEVWNARYVSYVRCI